MNNELILAWLNSDSAYNRVKAARNLSHNVDQKLFQDIANAYQNEQVPWVKKALKSALEKYEPPDRNSGAETGEMQQSDLEDYAEQVAAAQSEAFNQSIGEMLHELEPVIGVLKVQAQEDITDYSYSGTKRELDKLDEILDVFSNWRRVERVPNSSSVNLYDLIDGVTNEYGAEKVAINIEGEKSLDVPTDRSILRIALVNVVRNSIEALSQIPPEASPTLVVAYGVKNNVYWIGVSDNGPGLPFETGRLLKSKVTTKPGHNGFGLTLVARAVNALDGKFELVNRSSGGAEFYMEVPMEVTN